jgi:hypothetical protein
MEMPLVDFVIVGFQFNNHKSSINNYPGNRYLAMATLQSWILHGWIREAPIAPTLQRDRSRSRVDLGNPQPVSPIFVGLYVPFSRAAYPDASVPSGAC